MKKYFVILGLLLLSTLSVKAQEGDGNDDDRVGKLQLRMKEYIQKRLNLSKSEAEKFSPIFMRYVVEVRRTHRDNKADKPMMQLEVAKVRVKFRNEFKQIMDEQRANRVFEAEREFQKIVIDEINQRKIESKPLRRNKALLQ